MDCWQDVVEIDDLARIKIQRRLVSNAIYSERSIACCAGQRLTSNQLSIESLDRCHTAVRGHNHHPRTGGLAIRIFAIGKTLHVDIGHIDLDRL